MKLGKKLLSLLTVLCLTLSLFPTMAFAADDSEGSTGTPATSVSVGSTILSVGDYLTSNGTVTTTKPNKGTGYIHFSSNGTLELNGYTDENTNTKHQISGANLTIHLTGNNHINSADNGILSAGTLTISGSGSLTLTSATNGTTIHATNTIKIQGGAKVTAPGGYSGQSIHMQNSGSSAKIIITGSGTQVTATTGSSSGVVLCGGSGTIEVNDGAKLTATTISGTVKVNGTVQSNPGSSVTAPSTTSGYTVSGTVKNGDTPVAGASVQLRATGTADTSTVINTSNDGTYSFTGISEGSYAITVTKNGYTAATEDITLHGNDKTLTKDITLTPINYNISVQGTPVTGANKDNVLGDGTVTYTPATTTEAQKLTLNGMSITNTSQIGITASNDLTIALSGENNISGSAHAIEMTSGTLTITGPGSLNASSSSGQTTIYTQGSGDVIINGGARVTVENTSTSQGDAIHLDGSNQNLTVTGNGTQLIARKTEGKQTAINGVATLSVSDGATLTAQSKGTAISCTKFSPDSTRAYLKSQVLPLF